MPGLRSVNQARALAAFRRAGGVERSGKGSHRVIKMPNGRILSIPSGTLKIGLLMHLIKAADLTEEEFEKLL